MPELIVCADRAELARRASALIELELDAAQSERGIARVALSGGTTPIETYRALATAPAPWNGVELWFADERCVPPDDAESNFRLVSETLAGPAGIAGEQVRRMAGELGPEEGARRYAELLRARIDDEDVPALDLVLLGIGPEGHIASLFPSHPALQASELCVGVPDSPKPPPARITLGLPLLRAARRCVLLASGDSKAAALARALGPASLQAPASLLERERLTVIADAAAAALLPGRSATGAPGVADGATPESLR